MELLTVVIVLGTFLLGWLFGFTTGHSRGKVEAYEEADFNE